ncbi:MAG: flagellar hook-length control protein FliK [Paenibacillaceae bacterium]
MDMTAQSTVATLQAPINSVNGNTASSEATTQSTQGTGKASKSFTDVLSQTLSGDSSTQPADQSTGIEALLQGLSPALLMALLTVQGETTTTGGAGETELDPLIVKALQNLDQQSNALNQLIDSGVFQQWLTKVSDLLASMNANDSAAISTQSSEVSLQASDDQVLPKTALKAQAIVNQFMTALSQNKDSMLFQQLVEDFQAIVSPVLAAQASPKVSINSTKVLNSSLLTETSSKSKESLTHLQAAVNSILGDTPAVDASITKEAGANTAFKMQLLQGNKQFSQLDALSAKSGMADRMMLAAMKLGIGSEVETIADDLTPTNALSFQNITRMLQTDQVKAAQPMTAQSFVQDMSQFVMKNFKVDALNGFSEARLTLSPENLGQVNVKLTMHNGQLVAHFAAQTLLGKEMLEGQLLQLKQSLQGQGLQVERLEVTQGSSLQSSLFQEQRQQQFNQQFARRDKSNYSNIDSLPESFSAEMANMIKLSSAYSNGFDVTA